MLLAVLPSVEGIAGVHLISLTRPQSMTQTTSSMVMLVSATLVATTILRTPAPTFWNTRDCEHAMSCLRLVHYICGTFLQ